jgi:hypothetical protein
MNTNVEAFFAQGQHDKFVRVYPRDPDEFDCTRRLRSPKRSIL